MDILRNIKFITLLIIFVTLNVDGKGHELLSCNKNISICWIMCHNTDSAKVFEVLSLLIENKSFVKAKSDIDCSNFYITIISSKSNSCCEYMKIANGNDNFFVNYATDSLFFSGTNYNLISDWVDKKWKIFFKLIIIDFEKKCKTIVHYFYCKKKNRLSVIKEYKESFYSEIFSL